MKKVKLPLINSWFFKEERKELMAILAQFQTIATNLDTLVTDIKNGAIVVGGVSQQDVTDSANAVSTAVSSLYTALGQTPPTTA